MDTTRLRTTDFDTGTVRSNDGTLMTSENFEELARALANDHTVYLPDRRGRGRSGPVGPDYSIRSEVDDLTALLRETNSHSVFGLSSGAVIALQTAVAVPQITKLALYEPPLAVDGVSPAQWAHRYQRHMVNGRTAAALIAALKGTSDTGGITRLPRLLLLPLMKLALRLDKPSAGHLPLRDLVPTVRYDIAIVRSVENDWAAVAALRCDTMLLGGSNSIGYLTAALDRCQTVLPDAT